MIPPAIGWRDTMQVSVRKMIESYGRLDASTEATPARVVRALEELFVGYSQSPTAILERVFEGPCDEVVAVRSVKFFSTCEHHLLPFYGEVGIAYLPSSRVVGLSKLGRLVECFARRMQMQERMTTEIAEALMGDPLNARGAAVVIEGHHLCMMARGVQKQEAVMKTSAMLGVFRENASARAEALALLQS